MGVLQRNLACAAAVVAALAFASACGNANENAQAPAEAEAAAPADTDAQSAIAHGGHCANSDPLRRVFWGDLHVHTGVSMDAYMFGTRLRPADAYAFAQGAEVQNPGGEKLRLERPLDFAAVTDHAAFFGSVKRCTTPGSAAYDSDFCTDYRQPLQLPGNLQAAGALRDIVNEIQRRTGPELTGEAVCGEGGQGCLRAAADVWRETQQAAAAALDESPDCNFTTFIAYEYTLTPNLTKIHRNIIFRNNIALPLPISSADEPQPLKMLQALRAQCNDAGGGCDALSIPHNPNLSNGHMFAPEYGDAQSLEAQAETARMRAAMEPIVEMSQMKGDSECRNNMWGVLGATDELCDWEKMRAPETPDCEAGQGQGALGGAGCVSRRDYARYALVEGLMEAERIGANPFRFGFIAATDGHDGVPGPVEEWRQDLNIGRPQPGAGQNLGGLAGVWAEENSREALFEALRRRETYGSSGPRIAVRFFGGYDYPQNLCAQPDWVQQGYAGGVPMGGILPAAPAAPAAGGESAAPRFVVSALRDPGSEEHPGGLLQRVQIIKGWAGADGQIHQAVYDVAGGANGATVDTNTCAPSGEGAKALCGVWQDPQFNPAQRAVYYARVVENPSCRQTGWTCAQPEAQRPAWCAQPGLALTTQERAWTSPIWYEGADESTATQSTGQ